MSISIDTCLTAIETLVIFPMIFMFCALSYLVGSGIATYHVGVEKLWWSSECSGSLSQNTTLEQLRASLLQKADKPCNDVNWTLFGISMATYNVFFSSVLGFTSIIASMQILKKLKER